MEADDRIHPERLRRQLDVRSNCCLYSCTGWLPRRTFRRRLRSLATHASYRSRLDKTAHSTKGLARLYRPLVTNCVALLPASLPSTAQALAGDESSAEIPAPACRVGAEPKSRQRCRLLLLQREFVLTVWVDIDPRKIGQHVQGAPLVEPACLLNRTRKPLVLLHLRNHGAREQIQSFLTWLLTGTAMTSCLLDKFLFKQ